VAGSARVAVPGSSSPIAALSLDVGTFGTTENSAASYYLRAADGGASTAFIVRGDGRVGIGTATPLAKLHVDGDLLVTNAPHVALGRSSATGSYSSAMGYLTIATGDYSTALGNGSVANGNSSTAMGYQATASGDYSTAVGGQSTAAAGYAFAAGRNANAMHSGTFVWADANSGTFSSTANNQFNVRASGGVRIATTSAGTVGAQLAAGATSWTTLSDRNAKKNFQPLDSLEILDKLASIPVTRWNYNWEQDSEVPNIGPVAQDFKAAFYPGRDDTGISTLEFDGLELAAIQGLNQKLEAERAENAKLRRELDGLKLILQQLSEKVNRSGK
jgi:trimeric autotransporter adhesin